MTHLLAVEKAFWEERREDLRRDHAGKFLLDGGNLPPYHEQMPDALTETAEPPQTAALTAEQLGGPKTIGRQVRSDADLARAVELGFPTATIDALRKQGVTDRDIAALVIKPARCRTAARSGVG